MALEDSLAAFQHRHPAMREIFTGLSDRAWSLPGRKREVA